MFVGLHLVPGVSALRRRIASCLHGPYSDWFLVPHAPISVQPLDDPRSLRWSRLQDDRTGQWTFDGPPRPTRSGQCSLVLDPDSAGS